MRGRRGPEERRVCSTCSAWLSSHGLADASLVVVYNAVVNAVSVVPAPMLTEAAMIQACPEHWESCSYADNVYLQASFVAHGVDVQQASETQRTGMLRRVLRMGHWREFG